MKPFTAIAVFAFLLAPIAVQAQIAASEVLGTVTDASGSPVPKAQVTLTNLETGVGAKAATNGSGGYDFFDVHIGRYTVTVEATGFSKATAENIQVVVGARQRVDMTLQVGVVTESVTVTSAASALETDNSERSQVVTPLAVTELPLNGRNYADLALLSADAVKSPIADAFAPGGTPREGAFNVNGMRSTYNNFQLDGLDNNAYGTSNQGFSAQAVQPSPDAIAEFKLITSNYSAEYGRVGGAVVNAVMRSGTNDFHGTAYEFVRNTALNAGGFEFSQPYFKPPLHRNQFGASIGGPIIKNKLFFFGDYEGYRQLQNNPNFDSIPNSSFRQGVLPVSVVNPLNGTVYPAGTALPLSPFVAAVLNALPGANAGAAGALSNNYQALLLYRDYSDKYDAKVDAQINDRMNTFLRWSQRKDIYYQQPSMPGFAGGDGNGFIHSIQQNAAWGYTWTVTPTSILEVGLGFTHVLAGKQPPLLGGPSLSSLFGGFQGLPTTPNIAGGLNTQTVSGFTSFGRQTSNPQFQNPTSWDPKVSFSKVLGSHSLKMGYEYILIHTEVLDTNPLYGQDTYNGQFSKPTCAQLGQPSNCTVPANPTAYNFADFIFGAPATISQGSYLVVNLRQYLHSAYFQDDWRVTPKLTVNMGLRWDFATPLYERDNNYSNFDPATDSMVKATNGSLFQRSLVHPEYHDFGPRLGLAYSFDNKTVIRSGYGISYSYFNRPGSAMEGINAPQALFGTFTQTIPAGGPAPAGFLTTANSFTTGIANPAAFNPATQNVAYIPANFRWPYIQSWFFSVQRELPKNTVVELGYNGNHSLNLPILGDYNQAAPSPAGQTLSLAARRPIQGWGPITWVDPAGNNNYEGLTARVEHRFAQGLYFLNSFTWGHAMGDSEQALEYFPTPGFGANPQNIHDLHNEYASTAFDVKLNNVTSVVYQLPFGRGRAMGSNWNPVLDAIAGGWELNGINTAHTGQPIDLAYFTTPAAIDVTGLQNDYRGQAEIRPNVSGTAISQSASQLINNYFAGYTFTQPTPQNPFGNLGRNAFRAPNFEQLDLAVDKTFHLKERFNLQFRSEFFNLLNKTNFLIPDPRLNDASFGTIRSTYPPRQIQLAMKLLF